MNKKRMQVFDKVGLVVIGIVFVFSIGVALVTWQWFPGNGYIATIPQTMLSYIALLLPVTVLLTFLIIRRMVFKKDI